MTHNDESSPNPPHALDYFSVHWDRELVSIASMPPLQAQLMRAVLESEGIPAFVDGENFANNNPLSFPMAKLMVPRDAVVRAREILSQPTVVTDDGEYVEETWRCPKCHRKSIEMLPASGARLMWWNVFWVILIALGVTYLATLAFPEKDDPINRTLSLIAPIELIAGIMVGGILLFGTRERRCTTCGWRSDEQ